MPLCWPQDGGRAVTAIKLQTPARVTTSQVPFQHLHQPSTKRGSGVWCDVMSNVRSGVRSGVMIGIMTGVSGDVCQQLRSMRAAAQNYLTQVSTCHALPLSPEQVAINRK